MIPNIFVSSTISDLQYMRDAVRDVIIELGLKPIMSEHGEVGYIFDETAETSCYATLQQCQLAVVVIGKRYGSRGEDGLSITHNEFRTARRRALPVFCLVDRDILVFKRVYDANPANSDLAFPGVEEPTAIFDFVREVADSPRNNAILQFDSVPTARLQLRSQFALLLGDLLSRHADPVKAEVRDILSEVKALRHALGTDTPQNRQLIRAIRLLLEEHFKPYSELIDRLGRPLEDSLPLVIKEATFSGAVQAATGKPPSLFDPPANFEDVRTQDINGVPLLWASIRVRRADDQIERVVTAVTTDNTVHANSAAIAFFERLHRELLQELASSEPLQLSTRERRRRAVAPTRKLSSTE